jgi:ribosome maturation protein SDO1
MVSVDNAVVARINKGGVHFEILVDSDLAIELRKGKNVSLGDVLAVREVFKDAGRGERASDDDLQKGFSTTDVMKIAEEVIRHGDVQITTEHRRRIVEEKRKQIADTISRQGIDPKTNLPHPPQRILNAMEEARVHVDPFRRSADQIEAVLEKIQEVLPISMERVEIELRIPLQFAGKASSVIRGITPVKKEEWKSDSWTAVVEIAAGLQSDIYNKLNELTSGQAETRIIRKVV